MEGSTAEGDEPMRDIDAAAPIEKQAVDVSENDEEIDNDKLPWGQKQPKKIPLLEDIILPFPTPERMVKAEDRHHTVLANLKWMHKAQRAQQQERHIREIKEFQKELEKMIDWDSVRSVYPEGKGELKEYLGPIPNMSLNNPKRFLKPTPLDLLPAQYRSVIVQKDQLERLRIWKEKQKKKAKESSGMDVEEPEVSTLSIAELEYLVEDLMGEEIRKRKNEELELWMMQEDEKQTIYKTMHKEQKRAPLVDPDAQALNTAAKGKLPERRPDLPTLKTSSLVHQMEDVSLTSPRSTPNVASPREAAQSTETWKNIIPIPLSGSKTVDTPQIHERRFGTIDIPENRLHSVYDRRSPRREMSPIRRTSKEASEGNDIADSPRDSRNSSYTGQSMHAARRPSKDISREDQGQREPKIASEMGHGMPVEHIISEDVATFFPQHLSLQNAPGSRRSSEESRGERAQYNRHDFANPPRSRYRPDRRGSAGETYSESHSSGQDRRDRHSTSRRKSEQNLRSEHEYERSRSRSPTRRRRDRNEDSRRNNEPESRSAKQPWSIWVYPNSTSSKSSESTPARSANSEEVRRDSETGSRAEYAPSRDSDDFHGDRGRYRDREYEYDGDRRPVADGFANRSEFKDRDRSRDRNRGRRRGARRSAGRRRGGDFRPDFAPPTEPAAHRARERGRGWRRDYESYKPSYRD
ncbi:hypothetical protein H072_4588 [Dactylellina haptotyla CBS 200.50]|uniref:Uncharacterized protein n=1 Tax=Dactylellina haptotyla (strain CBS 200.50) TaxID=1284197 RepID=S8AF67_DACHA|nr:hypothetical protein H072_4588 [Dactylellina haptotyla CBS 200.50]